MNILISNDDGINAKGIHVLADALSRLDDVKIYVVAPDRQRSCCGHGLTMVAPLHIKEHDVSEFGGKVVYAAECDGLPSDCVRLGLYILRQQGIIVDLVCSGINLGSNYGTDAYYSGTLAAAREAVVCFTKAIAFSLCGCDSIHFEHFYELVPEVVTKAFAKMNSEAIINVNVPDMAELKGIKVCRQGSMNYALDYYSEKENEYFLTPGMIVGTGAGLSDDGYAGDQGYITITALELKPFNAKLEKAIEDMGITFGGEKALPVE